MKLGAGHPLSDADRESILKQFEEMNNFFNIVKQSLLQAPTQSCGINIEELHSRLDTYRDTVNALLSKPPPPQPKKEEEKKDEVADIEMKPEDAAPPADAPEEKPDDKMDEGS